MVPDQSTAKAGADREMVMAKGQVRSNKEKRKPKKEKPKPGAPVFSDKS